jgi:hypothetical protein
MNMQPTGTCLALIRQPFTRSNTVESEGIIEQPPTSTADPVLKASESPEASTGHVARGSHEAAQHILFNPPGATVEQSSSNPADSWDISFSPYGTTHPVSFDSPESMQLAPLDWTETQQVSFDHKGISTIIPPSGCTPIKMTGWTPRSFDDSALFPDALNQSPESEFDFSNFVTV